MPGTGRRRWHFGHAILDERTLELLVDGIDAELERKPLEVLITSCSTPGKSAQKMSFWRVSGQAAS
jgi:hypothetical protein